ncbi:hypothetical protein SY88_15800 [Clostridiales bacterium PH28_bin88]|nr:hypothetical protein SY88_15800 [Clostridiales bacterium PH28_bin88]
MVEKRLLEIIDSREQEIITMVQELVRRPSLVGQEKAAQEYVAEKLNKLGFTVDMWEPDKEELKRHPAYQDLPEDYKNRPVVVGTLKGTGGGRSMILNGHIDIVPPGARNGWEYDPFCGELVDGKIYGRGSTDMKSGIVTFLAAVAALQEAGVRLKGDVIVESVVDEERGGNGTLACVLRGYRADGAIIGEPMPGMEIVTSNNGALWFRVKVKGKAAHGAYKVNGVNAVEKMIKVYQALMDLERRWLLRTKDPLYAHCQNPVPISVGRFQAGNWPSIVPEEAVIEGRIGYLPGDTSEQIKKELEEAVLSVTAEDDWLQENPPEVQWFGLSMDSAKIDPNHPLAQLAQQTMGEVLGYLPPFRGKVGGTDMRLLTAVGVPTIQIGPGLSPLAHAHNEYVPVKNVMDVTKGIALILYRWCG